MKKGFTLIELMIVVVIIGILAAIAIPNFMSMRQRAKEAAVKANMHTLQLSAEDFSTMAEGSYPEFGEDTVEDILLGQGYPAATNPNLSCIADVCPGTRADVSTTVNALLPGNATYGNPFWPTANSLSQVAAAVIPPGPVQPGHVANPGPAADGQGTAYWGPVGTAGTASMMGYVIFGDGYKEMLTLILRSGN